MTQSNHGRRVAIIGGGLSGLATACHLQLDSPERDVRVFESGSRTGGVIGTETSDHPHAGPLVLDLGADMLATKPPAAMDLLSRLGVAEDLLLPKVEGRGAMIVRRGELVPIPEGFVLMRATRFGSMLRTPLLSPAGKLRLAYEALVREPDHDEDESVGSFVRRRLGGEMLDRIVGPLVAGIYTADVDRLSMKATMAPIRDMARRHGSLAAATLRRRRDGEDGVDSTSSGARYEQFRAFRGGMVGLMESLTAALPRDAVQSNCRVESVRRSSDGLTLAFADRPAETFDQVVVATPAAVSAKLLGDLTPSVSSELASVVSASAAIAVLVVRRADIRMKAKTFGFVVPPVEGRRILAGSFASEKFAGRCREDHVIVRVFFGGMLQPHLLRFDDEELVRIARAELSELIGLAGDPVHSTVVRWNDAMPQYEVGHLERVARIKASLASVPGLHMVSNALDGVGIAPLIGQAGRVAERIASEVDVAASETT